MSFVRPHSRSPLRLTVIASTLIACFSFSACTRELSGCSGPIIDVEAALALKKGLSATSTAAYLALANPAEATQVGNISATDGRIAQTIKGYVLSDLLSPSRLKSQYLDVRIDTNTDNVSTLATPNGQGQFKFGISDLGYWQTNGYYTVSTGIKYLQILGFSPQDARQFFVTVRTRANGAAATEVNGYYLNHSDTPSSPREMRIVGEGTYAPAIDSDVFLHETGHNRVYQIGKNNIDKAYESGAVQTPAAGAHEGFADYLAMTFFGRPHIGLWIARNFSDIAPGQPLRSGVDSANDTITFDAAMRSDGTGGNPERYKMGTWLGRTLWDMRTQFEKEDPRTGAIFADRVVFAAISQLPEDTSFYQIRDAILNADQQLHCGLHQRSIANAFASHGMPADLPGLSSPMTLAVQGIGVVQSSNSTSATNPAPGVDMLFPMQVTNGNGGVARDVRINLESSDPYFHVITYMQSIGDLAPTQKVSIGSSSSLPLDYSVYGQIDQNAPLGRQIKYRIRVSSPNAPDAVYNGVIQL